MILIKNVRWLRILIIGCIILISICLQSGCSAKEDNLPFIKEEQNVRLRDEKAQILIPLAEKKLVYCDEGIVMDVSNLSEGYFMVCYTGNAKKVQLLLETPKGTTYHYRIPTKGIYGVYPLSEGTGEYCAKFYENIIDNKYAEIFSQRVSVEHLDETRVFLYPNEYVKFDEDSLIVKKGEELAKGKSSDMEVVKSVYQYVTTHISYDYDKAKNVASGYLPDVDEILISEKGICFDYASLMAAMLRSQGIPTRLEIGYLEDRYHAWISVYSKETGWMDRMICFENDSWVLMDPTLASNEKEKTIKKYMNHSNNYYMSMYSY